MENVWGKYWGKYRKIINANKEILILVNYNSAVCKENY